MASLIDAEKDRVSELLVLAVPVPHSLEWARASALSHDVVVGCLKSLSAAQVVALRQFDVIEQQLTAEGEQVAREGAPEYQLWSALPEGGTRTRADVLTVFGGSEDRLKIALGQAMKEKWVTLNKGAEPSYGRAKPSVVDEVAALTRRVQAGSTLNEVESALLKRRQMMVVNKVAVYEATAGPRYSRTNWRQREATELTPEMLLSGEWRNLAFKPYNFAALGVPPTGGHVHPLMKVRAEFRDIFLELGYSEMPTNKFVESSFWNFDALFQPQSHPARDAHDTFFLLDPARTPSLPQDYLERVKTMHERGGEGSIGWRYTWSEDEARKNILRTHTTAISSRMLYLLAQQKPFTPKKYFSIDRVYRNETLDATHLAEFHQIEGLVADYNLTLADLVGSIKQFFAGYGIKKLKFKPAYNPYTEPSMEIFGYHPGLKRYVEIGNSGMFRPEMLLPMGLPAGVRVIAWGLGLERPTMIKYGISNIRQLVGHKVDLGFIYDSPICRFEQDESAKREESSKASAK